MSLDNLRKGLLYNNVMDVWEALCQEKGWDFSDRQLNNKFAKFLKTEGVQLQKLPVCPTEGGIKGEVAKRFCILLGDPSRSFVIRTDQKTVEKLRSFLP
ncbi:MAG: hypothetical protein HY619_05890 [Thaumarchaeota archaeon]|nr:hypothetical protein [Nitrososphaerota archaeon]